MKAKHGKIAAAVAVCALCATATVPGTAQSGTPIGGVTKSDEVGIGVAIAVIGAGIGIAVYYAFHHGNSLNGCAVSGSGGLQVLNEGDGQTYVLTGQVADIKPGDRVRVSGKKQKVSGSGARQFVVEKLTRDYGVCEVQPSAPKA